MLQLSTCNSHSDPGWWGCAPAGRPPDGQGHLAQGLSVGTSAPSAVRVFLSSSVSSSPLSTEVLLCPCGSPSTPRLSPVPRAPPPSPPPLRHCFSIFPELVLVFAVRVREPRSSSSSTVSASLWVEGCGTECLSSAHPVQL